MNATRTLQITLASAALVVGAACGTSTATENGQPVVPGEEAAAVSPTTPPADAGEPPSTEPEPTTTSAPEPAPASTTAPEPEPEPTTTPAPEPAPEPEPAPCGEFGPLPPRPDSMPTLVFDTDTDGEVDDEVTAYGAVDGWRIRVVENGVTSEVVIPGIVGWAYLDGVEVEHGAIRVVDNDENVAYGFVTDDNGCVQFSGELPSIPPVGAVDDFATEEPPCGDVGPIPGTATIVSDGLYDLTSDGTADDRLVSYFDGDWTLRAEVAGLVSQIPVDGVGAGSVEVLGLADVAALNAGIEFIATTGAGASTLELGVFGFAGPGCLLQYRWEGGDAAEFFVGATTTHGDATWCGAGYIGSTGYEQNEWGTYDAWSAAFEEKEIGVLGYMMSSDDFSEGLTLDELSPQGLDCFGLTL